MSETKKKISKKTSSKLNKMGSTPKRESAKRKPDPNLVWVAESVIVKGAYAKRLSATEEKRKKQTFKHLSTFMVGDALQFKTKELTEAWCDDEKAISYRAKQISRKSK